MMLKHIAAALVLLASAPAFAQTPVHTVSSEAFVSSKDKSTLIDVREPAEWAETGVPQGAATISISRKDFVDAVLAKVNGDKSAPVALICKSGNRSVRAAQALSDAGFTNVTNVGDGMMGRDGVGSGWLASKLPTSPGPKPN